MAPVPLPQPKPIEIRIPAPDIPAVVEPGRCGPIRQVEEVVPVPSPAVAPKVEAIKPQSKAPRAKTKAKPIQTRQERQASPASGGQAASPKPKCTPLPPTDCGKVCSYGRTFSKATLDWLRDKNGYCEPTQRHEREGRACIRAHCPDVKL